MEETVACAVLASLIDHLAHLPLRGRHAVGDAEAQRLDVAVHCLRQIGETAGDIRPVALGLRRHQVENVPDALGRGGDHVDVAHPQARGIRFEIEGQFIGQIRLGDPVDVVDYRRALELGEHSASSRDDLRVALRRQILVLVELARNTDPRGDCGVEFCECGDPVLGDLVDLGRSARVIGAHESSICDGVYCLSRSIDNTSTRVSSAASAPSPSALRVTVSP